MREFFHGWRRKAGCVTLALACVATGLWIRSYIVFDQLVLAGNLLISNSGCLVWNWSGWGTPELNLVDWYCEHASPFSEEWYFGTDGVRMPYWAVNIPLTLLSAYLLLWKPRPEQKCEKNA